MSMLGAACFFFFFNDTATTEIYTLSLHDALPISHDRGRRYHVQRVARDDGLGGGPRERRLAHQHLVHDARSEEHTSELQSRLHLVCRLLLEKKKAPATFLFSIPTCKLSADYACVR